MLHQDEFIDYLTHTQLTTKHTDTGHLSASVKLRLHMVRHGATIVRYEDKVVDFAPGENFRVFCAEMRRPGIAYNRTVICGATRRSALRRRKPRFSSSRYVQFRHAGSGWVRWASRSVRSWRRRTMTGVKFSAGACHMRRPCSSQSAKY